MVKCLPEFEYFTVFLKNKNIIFKIRRSKVTDYAALTRPDETHTGKGIRCFASIYTFCLYFIRLFYGIKY